MCLPLFRHPPPHLLLCDFHVWEPWYMLEDVIKEFIWFQMCVTRISDLDYAYWVAMSTYIYTHTHMRWRPDYAQHCGGRKGTSRKILLPSKELSIVKSTNVFLNQLGAWWRSQCHGTQRNKIAFWTELARRSSVEEDTTGAF